MAELSKKQKLLKALFYIMPHHAVSRVVYLITRLRGPQVRPMIAWFVKQYGVDMAEARESEIGYYQIAVRDRTGHDFLMEKDLGL